MASKVNSYKHRQTFINTTFESSTDSTAVEEKLFGHSEEEDDGPVVFICGKCKLPVGDSMSWDGSEASEEEEGHHQIRLKREYGVSLLILFLFVLVHIITLQLTN